MLTVPCTLIMRTINDADCIMNGTAADCSLSPGWNSFDDDKVMNHMEHCRVSFNNFFLVAQSGYHVTKPGSPRENLVAQLNFFF